MNKHEYILLFLEELGAAFQNTFALKGMVCSPIWKHTASWYAVASFDMLEHYLWSLCFLWSCTASQARAHTQSRLTASFQTCFKDLPELYKRLPTEQVERAMKGPWKGHERAMKGPLVWTCWCARCSSPFSILVWGWKRCSIWKPNYLSN